nr:ATP synthase F0 subunit 8 [Odontocolon albotibiale]
MPQMAPYNWLVMYITFNILLYMMMVMIHSMPPMFSSHSTPNKEKKFLFKWKW